MARPSSLFNGFRWYSLRSRSPTGSRREVKRVDVVGSVLLHHRGDARAKPVRMDATATTVMTPTTIPSTVKTLRNLFERMASSAIRTVSVGNADFALIVSSSSEPRWDRGAMPSLRDKFPQPFQYRRRPPAPAQRNRE